MVIFIDTSSLIKRYVSEEGSEIVDQYFTDENDICISPVTAIEIHAALGRKLRDGDIDYETHQKAAQFWSDDFNDIIKIQFNETLVEIAIRLIEANGIKTLDAIQAGSAVLSRSDELVTSDRQMFKVFQSFSDRKSTFI